MKSLLNRDTAIQQKPTNFIRSGWYHYGEGNIYSLTDVGECWILTSLSTTSAASLGFLSSSSGIGTSNSSSKGVGFPIRCLVR